MSTVLGEWLAPAQPKENTCSRSSRSRLCSYLNASTPSISEHNLKFSARKKLPDCLLTDLLSLIPSYWVLTNIHTVNESSSGGKPYFGGSIRQNACPSGTKTKNIQVQLLLTSGPFLASRHQDNSILNIFLTSPPYILFFSATESRVPRNRWTNSV